MFGSIIITCYKARLKILIVQWLQQHLLFLLLCFFQFNNLEVFMDNGVILFTWFAIGFAVSQYQGWRKLKNILKNNFSKIV